MEPHLQGNFLRTLLVTLVLGAATIAGCIGAEDLHPGAPEAELAVEDRVHFAGTPVRFDLSASNDPNGEIVAYHIDFGDGTEENFSAEQLDEVEHVYEAPGRYHIVLTVTDDGAEQDAALNATDEKEVEVHDRHDVNTPLVVAVPDAPNQVERHTQHFDVGENATGIEVDLTLEGALVVGSSEATVRLLNATGEILAEENVTVEGSDQAAAHLFTPLMEAGNHTLEIVSQSGAFRANGTLIVYYGILPETPTPEDGEDAEANNTTRP